MSTLATGLVVVSCCLAFFPAFNTLFTALLLRKPPLPLQPLSVAILIPARDEEKTIRACVEAALASTHADIEVIVLDDGSTDRTRAIVEEVMRGDSRLRIETAPPLPPGWKGKSHACHVLSTLTNRPYLLFVDADVRLAPEAAARLAPLPGQNLVSGVPRQQVDGFLEAAIVPMINSLLFGYLPLFFADRLKSSPAMAAACGQLLMVRTQAYRACGGHEAIRARMHDALHLARNFRRLGHGSTLVDATELASCRMYEDAASVWSGFSKNATEGMARPVALPIWTILLLGGQILPFVLLVLSLLDPASPLWQSIMLGAVSALLVTARSVQAAKCRERWTAVAMHPIGIVLTLCIQWQAFVRYLRGGTAIWRGRSYALDL